MPRNYRILFLVTLIFLIIVGLLFWILFNQDNLKDALAQVNTQKAPVPSITISYPTGYSIKNLELTITPTATLTQILTPTPTPTKQYSHLEIIGYSVDQRPLEVYRFGNGEHALMIVAGIHGGYEWNTVILADELINILTTDQGLVPPDKTLYILRVLNPDGYEKDKGPDGRANSNNVDINRNWDANWQENWYGTQCWNYRIITAGFEPGSEPETQALAKFLKAKNIEAVISYHSAGLGIFPGGWPYDKDSMKLAYSLAQVSPYSYPPIETDCLYTGQFIDWASAQGIAAVDVELTNHVDTDIYINLNILKAFFELGN